MSEPWTKNPKNKQPQLRLFFSVGRCDFQTMTLTSCLQQLLKIAFGDFVLASPGIGCDTNHLCTESSFILRKKKLEIHSVAKEH